MAQDRLSRVLGDAPAAPAPSPESQSRVDRVLEGKFKGERDTRLDKVPVDTTVKVVAPDGGIRDVTIGPELVDALAKGEAVLGDTAVAMVSSEGDTVQLPPAEILGAVKDGWRFESTDEQRGRRYREAWRESVERAGGGGAAFLTGVGSGASLGLSKVIGAELGVGEAIEAQEREHPTLTTAGELVGAILPSVVPGGQFVPAGQLGRLSSKVYGIGKGAGAVGRVASNIGAGALEGGVFSAGLTFGEARIQGADIETAVSAAFEAGGSGVLWGGGAGLIFGLGGEGFRRVLRRRAEALEAADALTAIQGQMEQMREVIRIGEKGAKDLTKAGGALRLAEGRVDDLRLRGASGEALEAAEREFGAAREALRGDKGLAKEAAREADGAFRQLRKTYDAERKLAPARASERMLATRVAGDKVWGMATFVANRVDDGLPMSAAGRKAWERLVKTQDDWDDFFGIPKGISKVAKKTKKKKVFKSELSLEEMATRIRKDPGKAAALGNDYARAMREVMGELEADGMLFVRGPEAAAGPGLNRPGGELAGAAVQHEAALGVLGRRAEQGMGELQLDDFLLAVRDTVQITPELQSVTLLKARTAAQRAERAAQKAEVAGGRAEDLAAQGRLLKELRRDRRLTVKAEEDLAKAAGAAREARTKVDRMNEAKLVESQIRPLIDEWEAMAKKAGFEITKADLAMVALDLGVDDPSLDWLVKGHFLLRFMGGKGFGRGRFLGSGFKGRVAESAAGGLGGGIAREIASKAVPQRGILGRLLSRSASSAGYRAGREFTRGAAARGAKGPILLAETRAAFRGRVERSLRRLDKVARAPTKLVALSAASILSGVSFSEMKHPRDPDLPQLQRIFEQRARELDTLVSNPEAMRATIETRLSHTLADSDEELLGLATEAMMRATLFLHDKLPPARKTSLFDQRRNASDAEIEQFATYVRYTSDPATVFEDLADLTLGVEGPETLRDVHPELYADGQRQLIERTYELGDDIPYETRTLISVTWNLPLESALDPVALALMGELSAQAVQPPQPTGRVLRSPGTNPTQVQSIETR